MSVTLITVHDIGRAGDPTATVSTTHYDTNAALSYLAGHFGIRSIRGDGRGGTIGAMSGRVFQASKTWVIRATEDDGHLGLEQEIWGPHETLHIR